MNSKSNAKNINSIRQHRMKSVFSNLLNDPFTIIEAPMGYGKTTAVKYFLAQQQPKQYLSIWVSIADPYEALPHVWHKLSKSLAALCPSLSEQLLYLGFPSDTPQLNHILELFTSLNITKPTLLVIDDFHFTEGQPLGHFLSRLVMEEIENLHLVVITRDMTHLNYPELIAKGLCHVVSKNELLFSPEEATEYCKQLLPSIEAEPLNTLIQYADGWIALIYIQLLGIKKGLPIGMNTTLEALIDKVLYQTLDSDTQHFLHRLTLCDHFSVQQAQFITGDDLTAQRLTALHKSNAFIHHNEHNNTYHVHPVLRTFLQTKCHFDSHTWQTLNRRMGEWYIQHNEFKTAYAYLYSAGEYERILSHLNAPENIRNDLTAFKGSEELFSTLTPQQLHAYPLTFLQHMLLSIITGNSETIQACGRDLDAFKAIHEKMDDPYHQRMAAESMIIKKFTLFNDLEASLLQHQEILTRLKGQQSYIMQADNEVTFGAPHLLYIYFKASGGFKKIMDLAKVSFDLYSQYANGCGTGADYIAEAEYALETGDFNKAKLLAQKSIIAAQTKNQVSIVLCARLTLMRICLYKGYFNEIMDQLKALELEVQAAHNPILNTSLDMVKGYIFACLGKIEKIPQWLLNGDMTGSDFFHQGIAFNYLVYGKSLVAQKDWITLDVQTREFERQFDVFSNRLGTIHNAIFKTLATLNLEGETSAISAFNTAIQLGEPDQLIMPFVEYSLDLEPLFKKISPQTDYTAILLKHCEHQQQVLKNHIEPPLVLSKREKEVLELSAQGHKRLAIAKHLQISEGTVKTHFQNIYIKFGVNSKIAAIKKAETLHLI